MNTLLKRIYAKKHLGQNFLVDPHVREKIISTCNLSPEDIILEIGPGKGLLTKAIAALVKQVIAVEKDYALIAGLNQLFKDTNVTIIEQDILQYPFSKLPKNIKIIGNLPYNIATAIIEKVILECPQLNSFYMMVQREHAQRLMAEPHTKEYGSLTCFVRYHAQVEKIFDVKNTAFRPVPKVRSSFVRLNLHTPPKYPLRAKNEELLFKMIRQAFLYRRKTLPNTLTNLIAKEHLVSILEKIGIDPRSRPEDLSLEDFIKLTEKMDVTFHPSL